MLMAQTTSSIRGTVVDENRLPLPGVAVILKGTDVGTVTDDKGCFDLKGVREGAELEFNSLGYLTAGAKATLSAPMTVVLKEDTTLLDDVVVVGYGVQKKSDLTGAISSVNAEEALKKMPVDKVSDLLQGRVAGLSVVSSSGAAGSSQTMRIRGTNSIKADGGPLVVIDGFAGGSMDSVNPADVKSIEILKDASSTAIYGSRGANGVILISTKTPKGEKQSVSYNGYVDFGTPQSLPEIMHYCSCACVSRGFRQPCRTCCAAG